MADIRAVEVAVAVDVAVVAADILGVVAVDTREAAEDTQVAVAADRGAAVIPTIKIPTIRTVGARADAGARTTR